MEKWSKKEKVPFNKPEDGNLGGVYACGSYIFAFVKPGQPHWDTVDTIIHESVHVFEKVISYIGEAIPGEEVRAYTTASIAINLMKDFHAQREVS